MGNAEWVKEIKELSDRQLANRIIRYSHGSYLEMVRDEAIARILLRK